MQALGASAASWSWMTKTDRGSLHLFPLTMVRFCMLRLAQHRAALALLVALRLWRSRWCGQRPRSEGTSDNVSVPTMVAFLKSVQGGSLLVAREMALDVAIGSLQPVIVSHALGVSASVADALSRQHQPGVEFKTPVLLNNVEELPTHPLRGLLSQHARSASDLAGQ